MSEATTTESAPSSESPTSAAPPAAEATAAAPATPVLAEATSPPLAESHEGSPDGAAAVQAPEVTPEPTVDLPALAASYEFTFPEGFTPHEDLLTETRSVLAQAGVPKDKAQSVMDLYAKSLTQAQATAQAAFEATQREWMTQINAMKEFQGPTRETSLASIGRVIDEYGPEVREVLNDPRVGNNPALARFMLNVASALSEGAPSTLGRPAVGSGAKRTLAQRLYPDAKPN